MTKFVINSLINLKNKNNAQLTKSHRTLTSLTGATSKLEILGGVARGLYFQYTR